MCPSLIETGSKTAEKKRCTNKQTDRHYENNGHLAVNQWENEEGWPRAVYWRTSCETVAHLSWRHCCCCWSVTCWYSAMSSSVTSTLAEVRWSLVREFRRLTATPSSTAYRCIQNRRTPPRQHRQKITRLKSTYHTRWHNITQLCTSLVSWDILFLTKILCICTEQHLHCVTPLKFLDFSRAPNCFSSTVA